MLHLEQGRTLEVEALARQMAPIFKAQGVGHGDLIPRTQGHHPFVKAPGAVLELSMLHELRLQALRKLLDVAAGAGELGVGPGEIALRAATFWPAVALKVEKEVGTVTPGKRANVIAVRGDVLRHVDLLQNVEVVIKGGVRYK